MDLQNWLTENSLDGNIDSNILTLNNKQYYIFEAGEDEVIFDEHFRFALEDEFVQLLEKEGVQDIVFKFGEKWYFSPIEEPVLNILKYIGTSVVAEQGLDIPHLGVHGKYDFCNGSRDYSDWCIKAKFLGISTLAICEQDTLAGTLSFQIACKEASIKSILGETVTVTKNQEYQYKIKLYCINEEGWRNLLNINAQIKVFNEGFVTEQFILEHSKGLVCVIDCITDLSKIDFKKYQKIFGKDKLYYQFDLVEWSNPSKENEHLQIIKDYVNKWQSLINPVLVCDSYYLDKDESHIKKILNKMGQIGFQNESRNQHFKSINDIIEQCDELFGEQKDKCTEFVDKLLNNTLALSTLCDFKIKLGEIHLPAYEMTEVEQKEFDTVEDLFWNLISKGLEEKIIGKVEDESIYIDRVQEEVRVIEMGGFIPYFLITWDILNWCKNNDILTSIGRGSSAGSLVAYLLNIVKIDPLKYDLLFERFLSENRIGTSLPDIDNDIQSDRRDDVKRYIENRYGINYVTSIGTYGTFKAKAAIKDLGRNLNVDYSKTNYVTGLVPEDADFTEIFKVAVKSSKEKTSPLKSYIQQYPQVVENYPLIANQPGTVSIHAAGIIIIPKTYNGQSLTIYDWMPVKKMDGVIVTEWEGEQLEKAGYLKLDILGILQLQKFAEIIKLIEQNHKKKIDFDSMDLKESGVYELFQEGLNEDVFQFGAAGLKAYCKDLKPENIDDLIATVALYRPGPIESGSHKKYVNIKHGKESPEYDYMLEDITRNTYGLYCYQEQVMKAVHILGGLTLVEAEDVRKAMGKKIADKMEKYKVQFINGAIKNKCSELEAIAIWNKLERFASYGFNKSHAAAYAHVGFFSQWLKYKFPIEFWSICLRHSKQELISSRIGEMHKVSEVRVLPPDINESVDAFKPDFEKNHIFWSISSILQIGDVAMAELMKERNERGKFFSFEDFHYRIEKRVNKRQKMNLIMAGCFDIIENIKSPTERYALLKKFVNIIGEDLPEELTDPSLISKEHFWILKQKELTGFGTFDFEKIYKTNFKPVKNFPYLDPSTLQDVEMRGKYVTAVGIFSEVIDQKMKNKPGYFGKTTISSNDENMTCLIWDKIWPDWKDLVMSSKNKIVAVTAVIKYDEKYSFKNVIQTIDNTDIVVLN